MRPTGQGVGILKAKRTRISFHFIEWLFQLTQSMNTSAFSFSYIYALAVIPATFS
jgi:hypothetical protein